MMPLVLISAIAGLPVLLGMFLRVNSALLFLALASGALLQRAIGDSTELALATVAKDLTNSTVALIADLGLLLLPVLLTFLTLRKSAKKSQVLLNLLPLALTGLACAALVVPLLTYSLQNEIYQLSFGGIFKQSQDLIVAVAAAVNLFFAYSVFRYKEDSKKKHH